MLLRDSEAIHSRDTLTAYVDIWGEGRKETGFTSPTWAGAYGMVLHGVGRRQELWGAGYATFDDALRASAVQRVLGQCGGFKLVVHTKGLLDHVRYPGGHVWGASRRPGNRTASGEPYDHFDCFHGVATAIKDGRCELVPVRDRSEPPEFFLARDLARGIGRTTAQSLKPLHWHAIELEPRCAILATDDNPDPYGLLGKLDAAE